MTSEKNAANMEVTDAIMDAEHHPSVATYERVLKAEQALVSLYSEGTVEGDIARRGVVSAEKILQELHSDHLKTYRKLLKCGADIDDTGRYRYRLWRYLTADEDGPAAIFVMLNPSTADNEIDDPTIRRCKGFARAWKCGLLIVVNLYAYRATDPADLRAEWRRGGDIVGPDNDVFLKTELATKDAIVVAAWGAVPAWMMPRVRAVEEIARQAGVALQALATTKSGHPRHPLYLPGKLTPRPWSSS